MSASNLAAVLTAAAGLIAALTALAHTLNLGRVVRSHKANPYVHQAKAVLIPPAAQLRPPMPSNGVQTESDAPL